MVEKIGIIKPICVTCGWEGNINPYGRSFDETQEQALVSAILEARLDHLCPTAKNGPDGKLITHEIKYESIKK